MLPEIEKRDIKEDTVIVQVHKHNLRMDETEDGQIRRHDTEDEAQMGEVVVMGIFPRLDLSEAIDSKRNQQETEENVRGRKVRYFDVAFNSWKGW